MKQQSEFVKNVAALFGLTGCSSTSNLAQPSTTYAKPNVAGMGGGSGAHDQGDCGICTISEHKPVFSSIEPTPVYEFNSDKEGIITSNYNFISTSNALVGVNKIRFSSLKQGNYNDIWIKVKDRNGAISNKLTVNNFYIIAPDFVNHAGMSNTNDSIANISGTCMQGEELTCSIVGNSFGTQLAYIWYRITDARGPDETSEPISGATNKTYTLQNDDVGKRIQVELSYTDNKSNPVRMKTWYSPVVTDKTSLTIEFVPRDENPGAYRVDTHGQDDNPTLTLERGKTYTFAIQNSGSHPLRIQTNDLPATEGNAELYSTGLSHSSGVTGESAQNKTDGILTFVVPNDAPDTLYYRCQVHSSMVGTINIVSTKLRIYYDDALLKDIVDKSSEILEDLFIKFKQDYNIIVRVKEDYTFISSTIIAQASYQSQTIDINKDLLNTTEQGTLNDKVIYSYVTTFIHEIFHIFEVLEKYHDRNHFIYTGREGLEGYKKLIT